jgi:hypothetical protein
MTARTRDLMPRFGMIYAEAAGGFVGSSGRWLTLRRPGNDRPELRVRDAWLIAAGGSRVTWCRGDCDALHVWGPGRRQILRPPAGVRLQGREGAFSPTQEQLATAVTVDGRSRAAVVDMRSGSWTLVPGGRLGGYEALAWSPSGRWLYFTDSNKGLRAWRVGAARAVSLPVKAGGTVMSIATAPD